jgi:hypothetical protein
MSASIDLTNYVSEVVPTKCHDTDMNCHSTLSEYATQHDNCESTEKMMLQNKDCVTCDIDTALTIGKIKVSFLALYAIKTGH